MPSHVIMDMKSGLAWHSMVICALMPGVGSLCLAIKCVKQLLTSFLLTISLSLNTATCSLLYSQYGNEINAGL